MKHIHRFHRINIGQVNINVDEVGNKSISSQKEVWVMKCVKDNCPHYTRMRTKLSAPLLRDTISECNRCGEPFILNRRSLRMTEPCCDNCVKRRKNVEIKQAEEFFKELEKEIAK